MTDNTSTVAYLNNQGGTKSRQMCQLAEKILIWAEQQHIWILSRHIPGHLNVLADSLSRQDQVIPSEWCLHSPVFHQICQTWMKPQVDLFALANNAQLPIFISPIPQPSAWKVDALIHSWEGLTAYAYPPTCLVRACLNKVWIEDVILILIAPCWPNQEWFADILNLSISEPLRLPAIPHLLHQTFSKSLHPNPTVLSLHAWLLSNDRSKREVFRKKCPQGSLNHIETPLHQFMIRSGQSSSIGAIHGVLIQSIPLLQK